jgi:hypothetical protein
MEEGKEDPSSLSLEALPAPPKIEGTLTKKDRKRLEQQKKQEEKKQ